MVVTLQRTRPPHGTQERDKFASGQDVNVATLECSCEQGKRRLPQEVSFESLVLRDMTTRAASTSENPGRSAICSGVAERTPERLPKERRSARGLAGPTPEISPSPVVSVRFARRLR